MSRLLKLVHNNYKNFVYVDEQLFKARDISKLTFVGYSKKHCPVLKLDATYLLIGPALERLL